MALKNLQDTRDLKQTESPDDESGLVRVTKSQFEGFIKGLDEGVKTSGGSYNGIRLEWSDDGLVLFIPSGVGEHFGLDAILRLANGNFLDKDRAAELLFSGGEALADERVVIDSCPVDDDGVFLTIKDMTGSLGELKSSVSMICGDPRAEGGGMREDVKEHVARMVDRIIGGGGREKRDEVERRVAGITTRCLAIVETSMRDKRVMALNEGQKFAPFVASFVASALSYYVDSAMGPAFTAAVNHSKLDKIKSNIGDHLGSQLDSIAVALQMRAEANPKIDMGFLAGTGSFVGKEFVALLDLLHAEAERSVKSFQDSSGDIVAVTDSILDAYIDTFKTGLYGKVALSNLRVGSGVLMAGEGLSVSGASQVVETAISAMGSIRALFDGVDAAGLESDKNLEVLWERILSSAQQSPVASYVEPLKESPGYLTDGLGPAKPEAGQETSPEQHENFKAMVRDASLSLVRNRHFADAARLLRAAGQTRREPDMEDTMNRIYNLATAMGSLNAMLDPGGAFADKEKPSVKRHKDRKSIFEATIIVSGELQDKYKGFGPDRISIPVNRDLPIMYNHLRLLKSIDSTAIMYSMNADTLNQAHGTIGATFGENTKPYSDDEKACVFRKFDDVSEIPAFFEDESMAVLGVALFGSAADPRTRDEMGKGLGGETSRVLLGEYSTEAKLEKFKEIEMGFELETPKAMRTGSMQDIEKAIGGDIKKLGIRDIGRRDVFIAFCKLFRTASSYDMLQGVFPGVGVTREAAYFNTGAEMARMIKSGVLADYGHMVTAKVRSNDFARCPYGLNIPFGCENVGKYIDKMKAIGPKDSERAADDQGTANKLALERVTRNKKACGKCKYARSFMKSESGVKSVVCNYGEANAGADSVDFEAGVGGSYPSSWNAGLFSVPSALGPEGRDSWMARSPGVSPFGMTQVNVPGM